MKIAETAQVEIDDIDVKALIEENRTLRVIAEHSTDMISIHEPNGDYKFVSPVCRNLLGYEPSELIGRNAYEFFHPEDLEAVTESHDTIQEVPVIFTVSYRIKKKNGDYVWFETTSKTIRDSETHETQEIIAVSREISERKRLEEDLAFQATHDQRTQLANRSL